MAFFKKKAPMPDAEWLKQFPPLRALEDALTDTRLEDGGIDAALGAVEGAIEPDDDLHATAAYRGRVAKVLLGRAIREARDEALA